MIDTQPAVLTGPITGGERGWAFGASMYDLAPLGYLEEEYFLEGKATRYLAAPGTVLGRDGRWQAEAAGSAPFKTRLLVYRPTDPAAFNGTVIVTWNNVTAGYELFGAESLEIFEGGFALVCVTSQKVGVVGLPPLNQGLADWDSQRYGTLHISSDDYSFDIFTQASLAVGPERRMDGLDPMGGLAVRHVVAQGASQSAGRLAAYVNAIAPLNDAFDGFILAIYFGRGTPLEVGQAVVNLNAGQTTSPPRQLREQNLLREDLSTPIFVVNSELEAMACYTVRQPDTDSMRFWESAGTCHVSRQGRTARQEKLDRDGIVSLPVDPRINAIPMNPVFDAAYHHMHRWLSEGIAPPVTPRVEFGGDPPAILRDKHGIAEGGIRLPQVDVPLAKNSAIPLSDEMVARLGGSSYPFEREKILQLYGNREGFLSKFEEAARNAVNAGLIMPRELPNLLKEAADTWNDLAG